MRYLNREASAIRAAPVLLLLTLLLPTPAQARGRDVPDPEWREGPVRYLLTRVESKTYKGLKSREERREFIKLFWKRRDPTPETLDNEFRDQFWRRVAEANDLFRGVPKEGWLTDRGKIYILLGPPNDIVSEEMAQTHRGIILWIYASTWAEEIGPNFVVAFARDVSGEFRISTSPSTDADVFKGLAPNTPLHLRGTGDQVAGLSRTRTTGIGNTDPYLVAQGMPTGLTELSLLADLGRLQQTDQLILNEFVTSQALFGEGLPVIASVDLYKAANDTTYLAITVFVKSKSVQYADIGGVQMPRLSVYCRLEDPDTDELRVSFEGENDFVPSPENRTAGVNDYLAFQAGAGIPPGTYRAVITVHDRVSTKVGTYRLDLDVPEFADGDLSLSSITLAEELRPLPDQAASDRKRPYVFGNLEVLPKPGVAYAKEQDFAFYFQVYNSAQDPQTGARLLDVTYDFFRDEGEGYQPLGAPLEMPGQIQASQGFSFPLEKWDIGKYRLRVTVKDRLGGDTAQREVDFLVR